MRDIFVKTLIELAEKNRSIELVTGDLGFGVLSPYWSKLPNQFTNAGIAEQNMTSVAAGMALEGKIVFTYSIGNFPTLRCVEQIRNDCAYHRANVKIVCIGGGFAYGSLGMSHQATEDIAVMRALPGIAIVCPGDLVEAEAATRMVVEYSGTCYLRLGRGGEKRVHKKINQFQAGKAIKIRELQGVSEKRIALFSTGAILGEVSEAAECLARDGIEVEQYSFPWVKPIDREVVKRCQSECNFIVTVEEHNLIGGLGSAVADVMAEGKGRGRLIKIGIHDQYCTEVGSQAYLRKQYGIDAKEIVRRIKSL